MVKKLRVHAFAEKNAGFFFIFHAPNYPRSCSTPYMTATAIQFAESSFTIVYSANSTLISNVLLLYKSLQLNFTTTHCSTSRDWLYSLVIFVVKKAGACLTFVPYVDFGLTAVVLPYQAWSNIFGTSTLSTLPTISSPINLSTKIAKFVWKRWTQNMGFIIGQVVIMLPTLIVLPKWEVGS